MTTFFYTLTLYTTKTYSSKIRGTNVLPKTAHNVKDPIRQRKFKYCVLIWRKTLEHF